MHDETLKNQPGCLKVNMLQLVLGFVLTGFK